LTAFGAQALLSLILAFWMLYLSTRGKLDIPYEKGTRKYDIKDKKHELLANILILGNDAQVLTGIISTSYRQYPTNAILKELRLSLLALPELLPSVYTTCTSSSTLCA
jgi:hypothetical protein